MQSPKALIRAVVDTAALRHNLQRVRAAAPTARVMSVIKANAYGHGLVPTAKALSATDGYAVARLEEGLALARRRTRATRAVARRRLQCRSARRGRAAALRPDGPQSRAACAARAARLQGELHLWIKIDTGMNRLGFRVEDFADAHARLVRIAGP
jgi:alanine racemase